MENQINEMKIFQGDESVKAFPMVSGLLIMSSIYDATDLLPIVRLGFG